MRYPAKQLTSHSTTTPTPCSVSRMAIAIYATLHTARARVNGAIGRNQKVSNLGAALITWAARRHRIAGTQIPSTFLVKVFMQNMGMS